MSQLKTAVFASGCFWCTDAVFRQLRGVQNVISGYTGGDLINPTYEQVSTGKSGHVEAVRLEYDPQIIKYNDLLHVFFATHDPTTLDQQGNDHGPQYRSVIFYIDQDQQRDAVQYIKQLDQDQVFDSSIVTSILPAQKFYPAEDHHQKFYDSNQQHPYCVAVINPKISKLRQKFANLLN
jgi:peptide-methionine (S)-S-oxide reductase